MPKPLLSVILCFLVALTATWAHADAPLAPRLDLDMAQTRQVNDIQAQHRKVFAAKRQVFNRESRALRRARIASDSAEVARLEQVTESLRAELTRMRQQQDADIRRLLRPDQSARFDAWIAEREQMRGSSRDEVAF